MSESHPPWFSQPPRGPAWLAWLAAAGWLSIIILTLPKARDIQRYVAAHYGNSAFQWITVCAGAAALSCVVFGALTGRLRLKWWNWGILSLLAVGVLLSMKKMQAEETFHFVQYGMLGYLLARAFHKTCPDAASYIAAIFLTATLGACDELMQWVLPTRYFDYRDIRLNLMAGFVTVTAIALGVRPSYVNRHTTPRGLWIASTCIIAFLTITILTLSGTPMIIEKIITRAPALRPYLANEGPLAEYGHTLFVPDIGFFKSRLNAAQLWTIDEQWGSAVAAELDKYKGSENYTAFLKAHPPGSSPFAHEVRVRLFRRDHHIRIAREESKQKNRARALNAYRVAFRENAILDKYYPLSVHASSYNLDDATRQEIATGASSDPFYFSPVSKNLITHFTLAQAWAAYGLSCSALLWTATVMAHRRRNRSA